MEPERKGPVAETIDTPGHRALGSDSRVTIMRLIRNAQGGMTAAEIAARTGLHPSTTRAHLDRLTDARLLVKARASDGHPGRPAWRYRAASADPVPAAYRSLAAALLDHLAGAGSETRTLAAQIGQGWGRHLAAAVPPQDDPVDSVMGVLDGLGFSPQRQPAGPHDSTAELRLRVCPFLELVGQNPDAMCGLHAGVIRGVLEHAGAPTDPMVLIPFGAPDACVARVPASQASTGERM